MNLRYALPSADQPLPRNQGQPTVDGAVFPAVGAPLQQRVLQLAALPPVKQPTTAIQLPLATAAARPYAKSVVSKVTDLLKSISSEINPFSTTTTSAPVESDNLKNIPDTLINEIKQSLPNSTILNIMMLSSGDGPASQEECKRVESPAEPLEEETGPDDEDMWIQQGMNVDIDNLDEDFEDALDFGGEDILKSLGEPNDGSASNTSSQDQLKSIYRPEGEQSRAAGQIMQSSPISNGADERFLPSFEDQLSSLIHGQEALSHDSFNGIAQFRKNSSRALENTDSSLSQQISRHIDEMNAMNSGPSSSMEGETCNRNLTTPDNVSNSFNSAPSTDQFASSYQNQNETQINFNGDERPTSVSDQECTFENGLYFCFMIPFFIFYYNIKFLRSAKKTSK